MKHFWAVPGLILLLLAVAGFQENLRFLMRGEGLPANPAARLGYIVGMFAVPTAVLAGAVVCGVLAARKRRPPARSGVATPLFDEDFEPPNRPLN